MYNPFKKRLNHDVEKIGLCAISAASGSLAGKFWLRPITSESFMYFLHMFGMPLSTLMIVILCVAVLRYKRKHFPHLTWDEYKEQPLKWQGALIIVVYCFSISMLIWV